MSDGHAKQVQAGSTTGTTFDIEPKPSTQHLRLQGNRNVPNTEARNTFRERSEHLQLTMCEKRFQRFCEKRFSALM